MSLLTLTASDCDGPNRWHWSLHDVDANCRRNALLAEHTVSLDSTDWQFDAWLGYRFPRRRAEVRFGVLNISDEDYRLSPRNPHRELPRERTAAVSVKVNF